MTIRRESNSATNFQKLSLPKRAQLRQTKNRLQDEPAQKCTIQCQCLQEPKRSAYKPHQPIRDKSHSPNNILLTSQVRYKRIQNNQNLYKPKSRKRNMSQRDPKTTKPTKFQCQTSATKFASFQYKIQAKSAHRKPPQHGDTSLETRGSHESGETPQLRRIVARPNTQKIITKHKASLLSRKMSGPTGGSSRLNPARPQSAQMAAPSTREERERSLTAD